MNVFDSVKKLVLEDFKIIIIYIIFLISFTVFYIVFEWSEGVKKVDRYLEMAVQTLPLLLEEDFHDRALTPESIGFEEELVNRNKINSFVETTELDWVYTVVNYMGGYYFSAPTVTDKEAEEVERWYFYPYEDIPEAFIEAYETGNTLFKSYKDKWGIYRSVIKPLRSPGGNLYLACADINIEKVSEKIVSQYLNSLVFFVLFIFLSFLVIFRLFMDRKKISIINSELLLHKKNLTDLVEKKTADIVRINMQLKHAQQQLKITIAEGGMGIFKWDSGKDIIYMAPQDNELIKSVIPDRFPVSLSELSEKYIHPEDLDIFNSFRDDLGSGRKNSSQIEFRLLRDDGNFTWISFLGKRFESELPDFSEIIFIMFQIIDERKKREIFLEKKAVHDSLTGIYNREYYIEYIESINLSKRMSDFPLTVCYIDINGLKEVNDRLGHAAGDTLLVTFCELVSENLRKTDVFCRIGGDEFLILCPGISNEDFSRIWNRIIESAENYNDSMLKPYIIIFSHGVIELSQDDISSSSEKIVAMADEMMYLEKKIMKNERTPVIRD